MTTGLSVTPVGQGLVEVVELLLAEPRPGAAKGTVQGRHGTHPFGWAHLAGGPEVHRPADRVETDEAHALVVEGPGRAPVQLRPRLAHVEVPVVLAGNEDLPDLELADDLVAQLQLDRVAELGEVAAEDQEVGGRIHRLDVVDRAHGLLDEAGVDLLGKEMRVRDPGEPESLGGAAFLRVRHVHGVDPRQPAGRRRRGRRAAEQRPVDEDPPREVDLVVGPDAWPPQRPTHLAPCLLEVLQLQQLVAVLVVMMV